MEDFKSFIDRSTCAPIVVHNTKEILTKEGYKELKLNDKWEIVCGQKYYVDIFESSIVAFSIGKEFATKGSIRIAAAHTDHPCFVIKPSPEMFQGKYEKINVESYGGAILNTWLDRPLGIAGNVILKSDDAFNPICKLIDSKKGVFVIPNIAIHYNRDVNKGVELNKQKDMIPIAGISGEIKDEKFMINYIAKLADCNTEDIIDYQLYLYNSQKLSTCGINDDIIVSPRIDNLSSAYSCISALCSNYSENNLNMVAIFDNEEVGSRTKQGAASDIIYKILKRIVVSLEMSEAVLEAKMSEGMLVSVDVAHATHPNQPEKSDPTNPVYLNDGVVIKKAASQSYATDAVSSAIVKQICNKYDIKYKEFVNKSDIPGGSTLGAIASTNLSMRTVDVGIPILAMHSAMETCGADDVDMMTKFLGAYFIS